MGYQVFRSLTACALLAITVGCASIGSSDAHEPTRTYVLVTLRRGPHAAEKSEAERSAIQSAHLANINRLAHEGTLVVAGPYGKDNHDPSARGIFIFDVPTLDAARGLTSSDPAVQAGVLVMELETLTTDAHLRDAIEAELVRQAAERQAGTDPSPGEHIRPYVVLRATRAAAVQATLDAKAPGATIVSGNTGDERGFFVLDARETQLVRGWLGAAATTGGATIDEWYASDLLVLARPPR